MSASENPLTRRRLLRWTGTGAVAAALAGALPSRAYAAAVSAPDLGITPGGNATTNRNNLVAALQNSSTSITFPPGDYRLDNGAAANGGGGRIAIVGFSGSFDMQAGARLVFTDSAQGGILFQNGSNTKLTGVTATYATLPNARHDLPCLDMEDVSGPTVSNLTVTGSPGSGFIFGRCVNPSITTAHISQTMADGLDFFNCQDGYADHIYTDRTGDDGVAFVNYANGPAYTGGHATNLQVTNSKARGVTVIGQSDVVIDHFGVNWSSASGVMCAYDATYATRVPTNVTFQNGFTYNGGALTGGQSGNRFGAEWSAVGEVFFSNVTIQTPGSRGVSGTAAAFTQTLPNGGTVAQPAGTVHLTGITVTGAPASGFDLHGGSYHLEQLTAEETGDIGIAVTDAALLQYGTLTATNTSKTASLHRAFDFEHNTTIDAAAGKLWVYDDQATPTGYVAGFYGTQGGNLGTLYDRVTNGSLTVQDSSGLPYLTG